MTLVKRTQRYKDAYTHRCTGVHIFGYANNFCPNLILFSPNNVWTASINVKTKTYHCKQIEVPACLNTGVKSRMPSTSKQYSAQPQCEQW